MAIRVQTQDHIIFGVMAADVAVTHGRFQKAGVAPVVRPLVAVINVPAGNRLRVPSGDLDIVYLAGETNNVHMRIVVEAYWDGEDFQIDLMTDANTVVVDAGYLQQIYSNWAFSEEPDA